MLFDNSKIYLHWKVIAGCSIHSVGELLDGDTKRGSVNVLAEFIRKKNYNKVKLENKVIKP